MHTMSLEEFRNFADLVRDEDPSIASTWLPADGRLQINGIGLDEVSKLVTNALSKGFRGLREEEFPMHYCAWGKARVGSTALTNLFGLDGFPAYYQPVKAVLRTAFADQPLVPWILPSVQEHPSIFTKETQGPYTLGESLFIPLQILIDAGYPPSRLHLIVLERDPERALASWLNKLTALQDRKTLTRHYVISALSANRVRRCAYRHGVPVTHYVYEASKEPVTSARALFSRLGLSHDFSDEAVINWGERGQLDSPASHRIIYPPQPAIYDFPGLHGTDSAYHYRTNPYAVDHEREDLLESTGVHKMYWDAVEACIGDLGLDATTAARLFGQSRPGELRFPTPGPSASGAGDLVNHP